MERPPKEAGRAGAVWPGQGLRRFDQPRFGGLGYLTMTLPIVITPVISITGASGATEAGTLFFFPPSTAGAGMITRTFSGTITVSVAPITVAWTVTWLLWSSAWRRSSVTP